MQKSMFPKGEKDKEAGTNELLSILKNKIDQETAKNIFLKSIAISRISKNFDQNRLKAHLEGYCIEHFNDDQINEFHNYLTTLHQALLVSNTAPSDIKKMGSGYSW